MLLCGGDPAVFAGDIDGNIIALVTRFQIDRGARIGKAVIIKRPCQRCFRSAGNNTVIQINRSALDGDAGIAGKGGVFGVDGAVILRVRNRGIFAGNDAILDFDGGTAADGLPIAAYCDITACKGAVFDNTAGLLGGGGIVADDHNGGQPRGNGGMGDVNDGIAVLRRGPIVILNVDAPLAFALGGGGDIADGELSVIDAEQRRVAGAVFDGAVDHGKLPALADGEQVAAGGTAGQCRTVQIQNDRLLGGDGDVFGQLQIAGKTDITAVFRLESFGQIPRGTDIDHIDIGGFAGDGDFNIVEGRTCMFGVPQIGFRYFLFGQQTNGGVVTEGILIIVIYSIVFGTCLGICSDVAFDKFIEVAIFRCNVLQKMIHMLSINGCKVAILIKGGFIVIVDDGSEEFFFDYAAIIGRLQPDIIS